MAEIDKLAKRMRAEGVEAWQLGLGLMSYGQAILESLPDVEIVELPPPWEMH